MKIEIDLQRRSLKVAQQLVNSGRARFTSTYEVFPLAVAEYLPEYTDTERLCL